MERILLFVFTIGFAGCVVSGIVGIGRGEPGAWLYLLAAAFTLGFMVLSWRRLSAAMRGGSRS